ncbi:hypothetical protein M378DRAFT_805981 [Amanita muscaria Koide BX008]|uniref:Uncharacterized protein n=1 Tax=Amanita muscaria (strain Koide BX008) TaxID=946122 RepID=A0A0C2SGB0_AMAMK|nr:hypothetical protein M378DRAFT_805981 [Amanita muscaria Koide BX008]
MYIHSIHLCTIFVTLFFPLFSSLFALDAVKLPVCLLFRTLLIALQSVFSTFLLSVFTPQYTSTIRRFIVVLVQNTCHLGRSHL